MPRPARKGRAHAKARKARRAVVLVDLYDPLTSSVCRRATSTSSDVFLCDLGERMKCTHQVLAKDKGWRAGGKITACDLPGAKKQECVGSATDEKNFAGKTGEFRDRFRSRKREGSVCNRNRNGSCKFGKQDCIYEGARGACYYPTAQR